MKRIIIAAALAAFITPALADDNPASGNRVAAHCNGDDGSTDDSPERTFCMGVVVGTIEALGATGVVCRPKGVTYGQATNVVRNYAVRHPDMTHKDISVLAIGALVEAWPCQKPSTKSNL